MKQPDLTAIRKQNLIKILDLMTLAPARTRQELADASGLSQMTVTNLVDLLKEQGVLQMKPAPRGQKKGPPQGRKADAISLYGENKAWLLVDISNQQFALTLLGFDVGLLLELHADQHGEYLARLEQFLQNSRFRALEALGSRELLGVAIVAPGPYDLSSDTVYNQRLPQLNGVRIKDLFRRCFGDYEYYVDEDVKFAVRSFSDLSRCELLYYLYIGEGVGGAAVHSGNMLRGLNATAGDAGHLLSGGSVTFESLLSTDAFIRLLGLDESLSADARQEALCRIAAEEPARYDEALDQMAAITAQMLHSVLWMLDPTHIIVDCIYARPRSDAFLRALSAHLQARFEGENRVLPRLCPGASGLSSVVRGAVHALQRAWLDRILM